MSSELRCACRGISGSFRGSCPRPEGVAAAVVGRGGPHVAQSPVARLRAFSDVSALGGPPNLPELSMPRLFGPACREVTSPNLSVENFILSLNQRRKGLHRPTVQPHTKQDKPIRKGGSSARLVCREIYCNERTSIPYRLPRILASTVAK